jgi:sugar transferase EpsL
MQRVGEGGKPFNFYKFRSMSGNDKGQYGASGVSKLYVTKVGNFLRKSRIDELPQLWNILKGDMSMIGPRPERPEFYDAIEKSVPRFGLRLVCKPGLTGWAQVNGRNAISWQEKFDLDIWYVDHQSFWLDVKILLITIKKVLLREDITERLGVTMTKFNGNKE